MSKKEDTIRTDDADRPTEPRNIETITIEILKYNQQFGENAYDVGKLLIEAKDQLEHGKWLPWLRERVEFSEATARRFIRIAKEYPNRSTVIDLGFSKAVALLEVPAGDRISIMETMFRVNDELKTIKDISCRELRKFIRDKYSPKTSPEETAYEETEDAGIPKPETTYYDEEFNPNNFIRNIQERIDGVLEYISNVAEDFNKRDGLSATLRAVCEETLHKLRQAESKETDL